MSDNTLDDLILTDPEPEKGKSKGLLALLALVILLIIVGAILAKMIFSDSNETVESNNKREEVKVSTSIDNNKLEVNDSVALSPITDDPDLAPLDDNGTSINANVDTVSIDDNINSDKKSKSNGSSSTVNSDSVTANELNVAPISSNSRSTNNLESRDVVEERPKKVVKHNKPKPVHKAKPKKHIYGGRGNVYIQVGSFAKGPEQGFINKIRRAGFKFRIKERNGLRKVFVGPFESRNRAANVLGIVKSKISSQAFIK